VKCSAVKGVKSGCTVKGIYGWWSELKWVEVQWSEVKVLLKLVSYTCVLTTLETRYCSFSPLCCFSYMHFVLICTVVVLYCFAVCVCACVSGFCNVCVCEGFVMCGWFWYYAYSTLTEVFLTLTEVFPCFFLSCKANARVKLAKTGHGPHFSTLVVICVVWLFVLFCVLFVCKCVLLPGDNPIAVNKYISCHIYNFPKLPNSWTVYFKTWFFLSLFKILCTFRRIWNPPWWRYRKQGELQSLSRKHRCLTLMIGWPCIVV